MPIPSRVIAPVVLAAFCVVGLLSFLWWQLQQSTFILQRPLFEQTEQTQFFAELPDTPFAPGDESILHLRQGDLLMLRGEWAEAEQEYEASFSAGGGLPALRKLIQTQLQRRDIRGVRSTLRTMEQEGARTEDIFLLETILKLRAGELVEAKEMLESAEDSPQKHYGLALLHIMQGNHEEAHTELTHTENGWDPILRSYARVLQDAYDEFDLFPDGSSIHLTTLLSRALAQVQECELALPLLVQVTSLQDDYRDAWIVQGYCELTTERPEQALASLEHAYSLDPQKPEIQYFLARTYSALYEYQNAITFFEYALTNGFQPQSEVRRLIAKSALEIGNAGLALEQYEAMTEQEGATMESFEGFASAAVALGRPEEALKKAMEAVSTWPDDPRSHELLGTVAAELDRTDEAREAFEKALELNPHRTSAEEKLNAL